MSALNRSISIQAALVVVLCTSCGKEEPAPEPVVRPVRYEQVFATGGGRDRTFSGMSRAGQESRLSFKIPGTVQKVAVKVGNEVKVGDLIAEIDPKDYGLQVQEAEAGLRSAQAQARNTQANYSRVRALYENRNASRNDLDAARAASESAEAQVRAAQNRLDLTRSTLSYARLTSPVDGSIAAVTVEENENVSPGQPVALLTSGSNVEVGVAIPEILIARIREGDKVNVAFDAIPDRQMPGVVTEVGVASTGMATTFPVTVKLERDHPDCRPGMAAEVTFRFGTPGDRDHILVPTVSVGEDRQGRYVYVLEQGEGDVWIARRRAVEVGELTADGFEIVKGLEDGERVVTAGVSRIQDGQKAKLLGEQ